jgi:2-polyprenyl-3-methyl-5-hydroxy-6-metoxy-1,4-benzoquinol methylase
VIALFGDINGKTIVDIGAGTGYFGFRMTSKGAKVISADVDDRFLEYVQNKADSLNDPLMLTRKVEYDDPLLADAEADHAIIVNTYHHINNRKEYFSKVAEGLKGNGSLMVVDFKKDRDSWGPPKRYRVPAAEVKEELTEAGFSKFTINKTLLENFYVVIAVK